MNKDTEKAYDYLTSLMKEYIGAVSYSTDKKGELEVNYCLMPLENEFERMHTFGIVIDRIGENSSLDISFKLHVNDKEKVYYESENEDYEKDGKEDIKYVDSAYFLRIIIDKLMEKNHER